MPESAGTGPGTGSPPEAVIQVEGLRKSYGQVVAVDGVDLTVYRGEIFGILGPNGAGKTTTLEMIEGLRKPDAGSIEVAGYDAVRESGRLKEIIGVQLQTTALFDYLSVEETLSLFADLYGVDGSRENVWRLLKMVSLTEKKDSRVDQLSGGQRQRLSMALALINDPRVVFLDEPTTGLDPQARRNMWDLVRKIRSEGRTVVLTTHYMEEAEELCDRVAVMDHGRVLVCDTPLSLIRSLDVDATVLVTVDGLLDGELERLPGVRGVEHEGTDVRLQTSDAQDTITALMRLASERGVRLRNLSVQSANLEDVFISYTGRSLRE
ncbi:ABC transporter ATP-binding protein [Rubrobacter calidifluminis]|uniref:ABC transporter ATP-binding protein n=1 Tax=Rubrobacter calidifluminis TaxID=1392640 RepID=UPI002360F524|nr:ABC transporter ATP-binding protein [Rubrobacter calidifluminis]